MDEKKLIRPKQAAILCGGIGTRMRPFTHSMPKPMIHCNQKPFLLYLINQLQDQGIKYFLLMTGYLSNQIEDYFGDGSKFSCQIEYSKGPVEWDTGRRIWEAQQQLDERFLLVYSDNFVPFPMEKVLALHLKEGSALTFMASQKKPGNIIMDSNGIVKVYDSNRSEELPFVEIGYMIVEKTETLGFFKVPNCSFAEIIKQMAEYNRIVAWVQEDAYHSISDPKRWKKAEEYLKLKKIILIDRDGVINFKAARGKYITTWDKFEWNKETLESMKFLAEQGFRFIVISNQAGITRGKMDHTKLLHIHQNMKLELCRNGIDIIDIYVCSHHWDDNCHCRKPKPGMFYQASKEYLFRLDQTFYIGNDMQDMEAAYNAGCKGILYEQGSWELIRDQIIDSFQN